MTAIYTTVGSRCRVHPQREGTRRCDRCRQPFCGDCISPGPRAAVGTRAWHCAACLAAMAEAAALAAPAPVRERASRAARRAGIAFGVLLGAGVLVAGGTALMIAVAPRLGRGASPHAYEARCGELSRIRSVSAIGTQSPDDAVNLLAYPQRAQVVVIGAGASAAGEPAALVDECDTGWKLAAEAAPPSGTPLTLEVTTSHVGSYVQRLALWQDPSAPKSSWVKDFELLVSEQETGEDFRPAALDRAPLLRDSLEPQWFQLVQPGPSGQGPAFTDTVLVRRMRLRLKSTYGGDASGGVALGEIAAYGSDREIVVFDLSPPLHALGPQKVYGVVPPVINALRNTETFVRFINTSAVDHHIVVGGGTPLMDLPLPAGQTRTSSFTIGRGAQVEFYCKLNMHATDGLIGTVRVK